MTKNDFFKLYDDVVNYKTDLYSLDKPTLLKIEKMLKEEIKMRNKIMEELKEELNYKMKKLNNN